MKSLGALIVVLLWMPAFPRAKDLGNLSTNPFLYESTANLFGKGSPFAPNGISNPFSPYRNPFSNQSAPKPFATDAPRLYDQQGNYLGKLSAIPFDQIHQRIRMAAAGRLKAANPREEGGNTCVSSCWALWLGVW